MPTYEYQCTACDGRHEIVQKMSDPTLTVCPTCGEEALRKLFNGVGVVFKGSGFYRTDSRSSDGKKSDSTSKSSSPAASGSSSGSSSPSTSGSSSPSTSSSSSSSTSSSSSASSSSS